MTVAMRCILGAIGIYFVNMGLEFLGITSGVGINAISVLTTGILGFPGFIALYGLGLYYNL